MKKSTKIIISLCVLVVIIFGGGYAYLSNAQKAVNPASHQETIVNIPIGSSSDQIANILVNKHVIKSSFGFTSYVKLHGVHNFKAGNYQLSPAMNVSQIVAALEHGGTVGDRHILVKEGETIDQIAQTVQANTPYTKADFIAAVTNPTLLAQLQKQYPELLDSAMQAKNVRYKLEGYLYPATYLFTPGETLNHLISQMVAKENEMLKPYFGQFKAKHWTVQEALSLAALIEAEGGSQKEDANKIAGVFLNRLQVKMPLQSDVAIHYALNNHNKNVSYADLKVKSPYNLYTTPGYGPGPVGNPSVRAVQALLNPIDQDKGYLYFVANMKNGKVYYSKTYAQHQKYVKKLAKDNA